MRPRALVIGGSVGGLLTANLLLRAGWEVAVFERAAGDLSDRGAGIGTRDELFAVLGLAGAIVDAGSTVEVRLRIALDGSGAVIHEVPLRSVSSAWERVYRSLRTALPPDCYLAGRLLQRVEQDAGGVTAIFADSVRVRGDLLIGADGIHSTVRRQFLPDAEPAYAGYISWRGVADVRTVPAELHPRIFDHMQFCFLDPGMLLTTPMPGREGASSRCCQFVWFRPVALPEVSSLCTDTNGRQHGWSIPPPLIRPEVVRELKSTAQVVLPPAIAALVAGVAQPRLQPIFDLESPKMAFGNVALLGDAAFVARPHVASGVTKAALDAQGLVDALAGAADLDTALANYERARLPFGRWLVARGRRIGDSLALCTRREGIERVMREYGAAGRIEDFSTATNGRSGAMV